MITKWKFISSEIKLLIAPERVFFCLEKEYWLLFYRFLWLKKWRQLEFYSFF